MRYLSVSLFLVMFAACGLSAGTYLPPHDVAMALMPLQRRELNLFANSKALIEELVTNLRKAAGDARDAIVTFTNGVNEEISEIRAKISEDIQKLKERVSNAVENITNRLLDSGVAVTECIVAHTTDANVVFNETLVKTISCVDSRIAEVTDQINSFETLVKGAVDFSNQAIEDMKNCTEGNGNIISIGSCLGSIALQTDMKAVVFTTQSGLMIARMNLFIATLPASLQVCASTRLVEAGLSSARIVMDIGTCSANSIFSIMTSNAQLLSTL